MESAAPIPVRVLVVEDNPTDQELLRHQLRKTPLGDHVRFFSDPRKALSLLRDPGSATLREGLVALFLDVNLPYMNGVELLRRIREIEGFDDLPVIVMTTNARPETLAACKELNVAYIAEKPVTVSQFSKVLADLFHQHQPATA
ncbi:MAG TPA: response regulator [Candidatus Methylacidiphilales bacterium]|jgi:CheY-like chemotaxis protein|nr:response regulator [Candidatus Methylacidiphilales bacterium]